MDYFNYSWNRIKPEKTIRIIIHRWAFYWTFVNSTVLLLFVLHWGCIQLLLAFFKSFELYLKEYFLCLLEWIVTFIVVSNCEGAYNVWAKLSILVLKIENTSLHSLYHIFYSMDTFKKVCNLRMLQNVRVWYFDVWRIINFAWKKFTFLPRISPYDWFSKNPNLRLCKKRKSTFSI